MSTVETTADERRLLRRASRLIRRGDGLVYLDDDLRPPARTPGGVADSLVAKGLLVEVGARFERTEAGDEVLARNSNQLSKLEARSA